MAEDDCGETEYKLLFDYASDGVFVADGDGRYLDANERGLEMLGYTLEELRNLNLRDVADPDDLAETPVQLEALRSGNPIISQRRLRRRDGTVLDVEISARMLPNGNLLGMVRDVTERRGTEEALRESEERYRNLVEQSPLGLVIFQEGRIVFANQAYAELTGYSIDELLALKPEEVWGLVHPEDRPLVRARAGGRLDGNAEVSRYEFRLQIRSGETIWIAIRSTLVQHRGRPAIQTIVMDITERKRAEERLAARESYLRSLIENTNDVILVTDLRGKVLDVSPGIKRLTGYTVEEYLRLGPADAMSPEFMRRAMETKRRLSADPTLRVRLSGELKHKDGGWRRVESVSCALVEGGAVRGVLINLRDVSDRWVAEEKLAQSQKMEAIGRLAGGISHDFNNVLTVILAECDMALRGLSRGRDIDAELAAIRSAAERAAALTRQLLAFSRRQFVEPTAFELSEAVGNMEKMLRRLLGEDVKLTCRLDPETGAVRADRSQIEQVLLNLVVNARDAMPRGGSLVIETERRGDEAILAVEDSGVGIADEVRARLFEPFFTTKEGERGTGLGLATSYGIVERFDGHISVESPPGAGARFEVHLPRIGRWTQPPEEETGEHLPSGTESILLVEDEPPIRRVAAETLREQGYHVLEAADAEEALARLREPEVSPDLLLTDLVLPGISGRELAERARKLRPGIRVLLMSGHSDELRHITPDRFYSMLLKPFTLRTLARRVRKSLDKKEPV